MVGVVGSPSPEAIDSFPCGLERVPVPAVTALEFVGRVAEFAVSARLFMGDPLKCAFDSHAAGVFGEGIRQATSEARPSEGSLPRESALRDLL